MMINKLTLAAQITKLGEIITLSNGDKAINFNVSFRFGNRSCLVAVTAYKDIAIQIAQLHEGSEVLIDEAFYLETYSDKKTGELKTIPKIRTNQVQYQSFTEPDPYGY